MSEWKKAKLLNETRTVMRLLTGGELKSST